jgi:hypothetical protein
MLAKALAATTGIRTLPMSALEAFLIHGPAANLATQSLAVTAGNSGDAQRDEPAPRRPSSVSCTPHSPPGRAPRGRQGFDVKSGLPLTKSTGTETCSCTIRQWPAVLR